MKRELIAAGVGFCMLVDCTPAPEKQTATTAAESQGAHYLDGTGAAQAKLLLPGLVSTGENEFGFTMSPDGRTIYFYRGDRVRGFFQTTLVVHYRDGVWSRPDILQHFGEYLDIDPVLSPDGQQLFYSSNRPVSENNDGGDYNIWMMIRDEDGGREPTMPAGALNSEGSDIYSAVAADGTVYFGSDREAGLGGLDLYVSELLEGRYGEPRNLGERINTEA